MIDGYVVEDASEFEINWWVICETCAVERKWKKSTRNRLSEAFKKVGAFKSGEAFKSGGAFKSVEGGVRHFRVSTFIDVNSSLHQSNHTWTVHNCRHCSMLRRSLNAGYSTRLVCPPDSTCPRRETTRYLNSGLLGCWWPPKFDRFPSRSKPCVNQLFGYRSKLSRRS